jgi:enoyl-CoA hydratase
MKVENQKAILVERQEPVLTISFNRPEKLNATTFEMWDELNDICEKLKSDDAIRYVIITSVGNHFTAGDDARAIIKFQADGPYEQTRLIQRKAHELKNKLAQMEQISFAAIKGYCLGAGVGLAIVCDFRIVTESAKLGIPETKVGMFYTWGLTHHLNRLVGPGVAKDMIFTARNLDAKEALRVGLVSYVMSEEQLMDKVYEIIQSIEGNGPQAVRLAKKMINASTAPEIGDLFVMEPEFVQYQYMSGEIKEGIDAYLEKRKPNWKR